MLSVFLVGLAVCNALIQTLSRTGKIPDTIIADAICGGVLFGIVGLIVGKVMRRQIRPVLRDMVGQGT